MTSPARTLIKGDRYVANSTQRSAAWVAYGACVWALVFAAMPEALFVSAGGYHHHIGMNIWESKGASAPPDHMTGLRFFTSDLPNVEALTGVVNRVTAARVSAEQTANGVTVRDPWVTRIVLRPGAASSSASAATLAAAV